MQYLLLIVLGFLVACGKDDSDSAPTPTEPSLVGTWTTASQANLRCQAYQWFSEIEFRVTGICFLNSEQANVMITEGTYILVDGAIDFRIDKATCDPNPEDYMIKLDELKADTMKTTYEDNPQLTWDRMKGNYGRELQWKAKLTYGCMYIDGRFEESPLD
jgi:hypothetical protein